MDVHSDPLKPWIMASHADGNVSIWDYQTEAKVSEFRVSDVEGTDTWHNTHWICSAKFIAPKDWIVAGGGDGYIYVVSYKMRELNMTTQQVKKFKAHGGIRFFMGEKDRGKWVESLAVHPTQPYVLSASMDNLIKLWNHDSNWDCIWSFSGHDSFVKHVMFSPDGNHFASASDDCTVKIWNIRKPKAIATLACGQDAQQHVAYFSRGDSQYVITGSLRGSARVWNLQTNKKTKILPGTTPENKDLEGLDYEVHGCNIGVINLDQDNTNPVLITVSKDMSISFLDQTSYAPRFEELNDLSRGPPQDFAYIESTRSLVIACPRGIAIVDMSEQMDDDMSDNTNDDTNEDTDVRPKRRRLEPKWMADYVMIKD
ncbi:hypothetical protein CFC21_014072 [Triticum aestivum]|uniref:Uncharacterized protein n=3 Tax=Triticum aestivum TaxID=4565 RepID=A0A3B6A386_WHEAT|nr:hypothetical protein CFC21_014072 [Triticum aestivum]